MLRRFSEPVPVLPMKIEAMEAQPGVEAYALRPDHFTTVLPDQTQIRVPVVLERVPYHVQAAVEWKGETQEWTGELWCFDLHSTDPSHPYSHTFWRASRKEPLPAPVIGWPPPEMQFFADTNGGKFLAALSPAVWLLDVSNEAPTQAALRDYISRAIQLPRLVPAGTRGVTPLFSVNSLLKSGGVFYEGSAATRYIPYLHLFGVEEFFPHHGAGHLEIKDIARDDQGNIVVSLVGLDPNKVFRAIFDGKEWHAGKDEMPAPQTP